MPPAAIIPPNSPLSEVGKAMGHQLLVGIHFIVMLFGELACHAQRLAVSQQKNTHGRKNHGEDRFKRHLRRDTEGSPCGSTPATSTP